MPAEERDDDTAVEALDERWDDEPTTAPATSVPDEPEAPGMLTHGTRVWWDGGIDRRMAGDFEVVGVFNDRDAYQLRNVYGREAVAGGSEIRPI